MAFPVLVLLVVFGCIAVRQVGSVRLYIWQVMLSGAAAVLLTGHISPGDAVRAIDADIMIFLVGMFVLGRALEVSGWLAHAGYNLFCRASNASSLLLFIVAGAGLLSALLMNDTVAIIGTLIMLLIAMKSRMQYPFSTFAGYLLFPTLVNLLITLLWLQWRYHEQFGQDVLVHEQGALLDRDLGKLSEMGLLAVVALIAVKALFSMIGTDTGFPLTWIALAGMLPVLALSPRRLEIVKGIDWQTLVFFASMFLLMQSVWQSGFFQEILIRSGTDITTLPAVMTIGIILSQLVSNVPLVALYLPLLAGSGIKTYAALAAASTIAGNVLITGAASRPKTEANTFPLSNLRFQVFH